MRGYLGLDVGSVSTKGAILSEKGEVVASVYLPTEGYPVDAIKKVLRMLGDRASELNVMIAGVATTGSGRRLAGVLIGADVVKNEITCQTIACLRYYPESRSIIEIGGQDSKCIQLDDRGVPVWYNMNSLCSAGTGSYLSHTAGRLGIPIEEFGKKALESTVEVSIAGKCGVFAESDLIHKQQLGFKKEDLIQGLCRALARNFINNVARNRYLRPPIIFSGGVANNVGVVRAFERELGEKIEVHRHNEVSGCIGAAICAMGGPAERSKFSGFEAAECNFETRGFQCRDCTNNCEIVVILRERAVLACFGSKCAKWETVAGKLASEDILLSNDWHPLLNPAVEQRELEEALATSQR